MTLTRIISAIGNNRSIYPLLLRDCAIEVPSKIYITRKENLKESRIKANDATREKFIDEYATSAVWLGGIPLVEKIADKYIKSQGFNPSFDINLLKENEFQGINTNIEKFKNLAPNEVKELEKIKNNITKYKKLSAFKFIASTTIPIALMGFILPKLNFALTKKIKEKRAENNLQKTISPKTNMTTFCSGNKKDISFGASIASAINNLKTVDKMAITDGGLTIGRVATSRNKEEGAVNAFRMLGSMFLNFVAPAYIAKYLDKSANKLFKINVNLDPLIIGDKELINAIKNNKIELPRSNNAKDLLEFIDNKPDSLFSKFAQKSGKISYLNNGIRNPLKYIDFKDLAKFKNEFENFIKSARNANDIEKFIKKAKFIKSANIISNVLISSALLAIALPKAQYTFNKILTGSYSDPGLKD